MSPLPSRLPALLVLISCGGGNVIALSDDNNFSYTGTVDLPAVTTAPGVDLTFCWDEVTEDIQCHDVDPVEDIDLVSFVRFQHLDELALEEKISNDALQQVDQSGFGSLEVKDRTCASLSELTMNGTAFDPTIHYTAGSTYLLSAASGTQLGFGTRVMAVVTPVDGEVNTTVDLESGCGVLDFDGDIASLTPVPVSLEGPWVFDWTRLTRSGLGNPIDIGSIDGLMLAHYETLTVADLQTALLDLELLADELWSADVSGVNGADLADLSDFDGFTEEGVWILALTCSQCYNPAPLFVTVLEPTAE